MVSAPFIPTRLEAALHVLGMILLVGCLGSFVLAPWTALPGACFLGVAVSLGLVYTLAIQRRTKGGWAKDLTFRFIGDQATLWRYIWSPSGVRRSAAVIRGRRPAR